MVFEQQNYIENVLTLLLSSNLLIVKSIISSEFTLAREGGIHHREKRTNLYAELWKREYSYLWCSYETIEVELYIAILQ